MTDEKKSKSSKKAETRRGAPDVIEKRRIARTFNTLFERAAEPVRPASVERRVTHLRAKFAKSLKPVEVLKTATELLEAGEPLKVLKKVRKPMHPVRTDFGVITEAQSLYNFNHQAWWFLGVDWNSPTGLTA